MSDDTANVQILPKAQIARIYVASRASTPERPAMWRRFRAEGFPIVSSWIDEAGEGQTGDFGELWFRICREVTTATALVLYVAEGDLPLKGALIEVGMALAAGIPVHVVLDRIVLEPRSLRPIGSWMSHPLVMRHLHVDSALRAAITRAQGGGA